MTNIFRVLLDKNNTQFIKNIKKPYDFINLTTLLMVFKLNEVYISILCPLFAPFNKLC